MIQKEFFFGIIQIIRWWTNEISSFLGKMELFKLHENGRSLFYEQRIENALLTCVRQGSSVISIFSGCLGEL